MNLETLPLWIQLPIAALLVLGAVFALVGVVGLLRFPELSSRRDQERIHQLTEYFLLGSFVSWSVALGSYVLLA